jgi:hypothetical protein
MVREKKSSLSLEVLGVQALVFLASRPEDLGGFLALSGLGPESLRASAQEPAFLQSVVEYICQNEEMLMAFSAFLSTPPEAIDTVRVHAEQKEHQFHS